MQQAASLAEQAATRLRLVQYGYLDGSCAQQPRSLARDTICFLRWRSDWSRAAADISCKGAERASHSLSSVNLRGKLTIMKISSNIF